MLWAIVGVIGFVFLYRVLTRADERLTDKRVAQQRLDDGIHWQDVEGDQFSRTITTVDFDRMVLTFRNIVNEYPGSDTTILYNVRRLDGPVWQTKLTDESLLVATDELGKSPSPILKRGLEERIEQAKNWATVSHHAPQWETAYQKHIHRR